MRFFTRFLLFVLFFVLFVSCVSAVNVTSYIYGPNGLAAKVSGGDVEFVVNDRLGNARAFVDDDGVVVAEFKSLPFGQ